MQNDSLPIKLQWHSTDEGLPRERSNKVFYWVRYESTSWNAGKDKLVEYDFYTYQGQASWTSFKQHGFGITHWLGPLPILEGDEKYYGRRM